ncbi:HisA/HisF-related TIM barrel protein [Methanoplanus limicola]|uniref:Histidine biosynthesis protein n=1 Tax=Methanoplanus limicola DSM 2279 TaxID=937775 RepID=H1YWT2_9EURY|nr:HisA/HisF-related TIM barrel protein [Methanoplanus limicola]EHQ36823.1 histidine biosynthesis protein [Methanoplanus limicola DSM 2279]
MKIILAVDIKGGEVVHGYKGRREIYKPLDWGLAGSTKPSEYLTELKVKYPYLADLDRICRDSDNNSAVLSCRDCGEYSYLNRGAETPSEALKEPWIKNVISTETCRGNPEDYTDFDYFSVVVKDGRALPDGKNPAAVLKEASKAGFEGLIVLNLSSVGAEDSMGSLSIEEVRSAYEGTLLYGGGVNSVEDLLRLQDAGINGAIIATAVHKGRVPLKYVQEGRIC